MTNPSPIHDALATAGCSFIPYADPNPTSEPPGVVLVPETLGQLDFEYASLRKGCIVVDEPNRGSILVTGDDRLPFLNNLLTNKIDDLAPCQSRRSFWLNRKGRIVTDLRLTELGDRLLVDADAHTTAAAAESLSHYLFAEDVDIQDASEHVHRVAVHGPTAAALIETASQSQDAGPAPSELPDAAACQVTIADTPVVVERDDLCGEIGLHLSMPAQHARAVFDRLVHVGEPPALDTDTGQPESPPSPSQARIRARRAGWLAVNTARIEAGTPLFNLDFDHTNLPAESGLLHERVDFKKGCYLGQEVVARMYALGKPKQVLVGLRVTGANGQDADGGALQPVGGSQLFLPHENLGTQVGVVTSSTVSPMLGGAAVCLASVRTKHADPGTVLLASAEGEQVEVTVQPQLRFWSRPLGAAGPQRS